MCLPQPVPCGVQWCETENLKRETGQRTTPQRTWLDEKVLAERFICEVVSLIRVHEIFSDALENETE